MSTDASQSRAPAGNQATRSTKAADLRSSPAGVKPITSTMPILGLPDYIGILVGGGWWCAWMFRRWRRDLDEYRSTTDSVTKGVIAVLWSVTALILISMLRSVVGIVAGMGTAWW